jgi:TM2 domain-containing membrane protein YozV
MKIKHKYLFWIPLFGGFFTIPGKTNMYNGNFYKKLWVFPLFLIWHTFWFLIILYLLSLIH